MNRTLWAALALAIWLGGSDVWAQAQTGGAPVAESKAGAGLAALEPKLREVVLRVQPKAVVELKDGVLKASFLPGQKGVYVPGPHLFDAQGRFGTDVDVARFGDDFAEFALEVREDEDLMYYRPDEFPTYKSQLFGTTYTGRVNLERLSLTDINEPNEFRDVPLDHWSYATFSELVRARLIGGVKELPPQKALTRYEFAVALARLQDLLPLMEVQKKLLSVPDSEEKLADMRSEFAPEISRLSGRTGALEERVIAPVKPEVNDMAWQPRYRFVSLVFSYGKGVDAKLVGEMQKLVADYAAANSKAKVRADVPAMPDRG